MTHRNNNRPAWLVQRVPATGHFAAVSALVEGLELNTVCQSADCPNIGECFGIGTATFLILGDTCTRRCRFCSVQKGKPRDLDLSEPQRVAEAVVQLGLKHAVITSVTRDDLVDGGAGQFAACIRAIRETSSSATIEVLVPDFSGDMTALRTVIEALPEVLNHNIETARRLYSEVRPNADYERSLYLLNQAAIQGGCVVKSGMMVGLGETEQEVLTTMTDLASAGVQTLTIGQYLQPSSDHLPVVEYIHPDKFRWYESQAYSLGFASVAAGPLVRSSYHAAHMVTKSGQVIKGMS